MGEFEVNSTFTRKIEALGYVLSEDDLRRIDRYTRSAVAASPEEEAELELVCVATVKGGGSATFASSASMIEHFSIRRDLVEELRLDYRAANSSRVEIFFDKSGVIEFSAYGPAPAFHFVAEGLTREIKNSDPQYHWLARTLAYSKRPRKILAKIVPLLSGWLLLSVYWYYYATRIGVNVDSHLLYTDNSYYLEVERALKGDAVVPKLDVLLKGQFNGFMNASVFLAKLQTFSGFLAGSLVLAAFFGLVLRAFSKNYPRVLFVIGHGKEELRRLERNRELLFVGVAVAFVVNVAAGLFVAFLA